MENKVLIQSPKSIHINAIEHGWYDEKRSVPELLCLIHSEVSEGLEAIRNKIKEGEKGCLSEELADVVIRVFDMSEYFGLDIIDAIEKKHNINKERPYRHGNKAL